MYEGVGGQRRSGLHDDLSRLGGDLLGWLRTRPSEQWLMFAAGVVVGVLVG